MCCGNCLHNNGFNVLCVLKSCAEFPPVNYNPFYNIIFYISTFTSWKYVHYSWRV